MRRSQKRNKKQELYEKLLAEEITRDQIEFESDDLSQFQRDQFLAGALKDRKNVGAFLQSLGGEINQTQTYKSLFLEKQDNKYILRLAEFPKVQFFTNSKGLNSSVVFSNAFPNYGKLLCSAFVKPSPYEFIQKKSFAVSPAIVWPLITSDKDKLGFLGLFGRLNLSSRDYAMNSYLVGTELKFGPRSYSFYVKNQKSQENSSLAVRFVGKFPYIPNLFGDFKVASGTTKDVHLTGSVWTKNVWMLSDTQPFVVMNISSLGWSNEGRFNYGIKTNFFTFRDNPDRHHKVLNSLTSVGFLSKLIGLRCFFGFFGMVGLHEKNKAWGKEYAYGILNRFWSSNNFAFNLFLNFSRVENDRKILLKFTYND